MKQIQTLKTPITLVIYAIFNCAIFSSLGWNQAAQANVNFLVASKNSSAVNPSDPGVIGHTFSASSSSIIESSFGCGEIVADINRVLVDSKLFENNFVYDYIFFCSPTGPQQSFVAIDLTVEAKNDESIDVLEEYRAKRQGEWVHKQKIDFKKLASIEVEKSFRANYEDPSSHEVTYSYSATSSKTSYFPNFAQYKNHIAKELQIFFRNPDVMAVLEYISAYLEPVELDLFKTRGMLKANTMSTSNSRKLIFENGNSIPGIYADGANRDCLQFEEKFCLSE